MLVRPGNPANVGAVARVVRNMGLSGLDLAGPGDFRTVECWRTAWSAQDVIETARVFFDLRDAIGGAHYVAGLSGRAMHGPVLDVRDMAREAAELGENEVASLVFGPESRGLTQAELSICGRRVLIPSHPKQPSLNLSHAVMVAAYEVFQARRSPASRVSAEETSTAGRATHGEKGQMLALLRNGLDAIGAMPSRNRDSAFLEWEAMFRRADLTPKEVRLIEHMARRMMHRAFLEAPSEARARPGEQESRDQAELVDQPGEISDEPHGPLQEPFADVVFTEQGFSIPRLKWRELLFVGAFRSDGDAFVRDPSRPLPPFRAAELFPEDARFEAVTREGGRVELRGRGRPGARED